MLRSAPVDGFALAYERHGTGEPVVLLHGWPGDRHDWREVVARLEADVVVCDLRGFGESDTHVRDPAQAYSAAAQARSVLGLIAELGLGPAVLGGYDVGSRVAQLIARTAPQAVRALVVAPPLPGAGDRVLCERGMREFWYQPFHQLDLPAHLIDGRPEAVRAYLEHFWSHWSGPGWTPAPDELDRLSGLYGRPGAFIASIGWYRAGAGTIASSLAEQAPAPADRIAAPATVLWPAHDPLFPRAWGNRLAAFFADATIEDLPDAGHFSPLEAPERFASAIMAALTPPARTRPQAAQDAAPAPIDAPLRLAGPEDADAVAATLVAFNAEFDEPAPEPSVLTARMRELLGGDDTLALIAEHDGRIAGLAVMRLRLSIWARGREAYLAELYVVPALRGRGLGRALMTAAMDLARAHGADYMDLGTAETDVAARGLYESLGFDNHEGRPGGPVNYYYEREL